MTKANWFEEVFLPSQEDRLTPKYPDKVILSEKQESICEKYMKEDRDYQNYHYEIGGTRYVMYRAGRYTFLQITDLNGGFITKENREMKKKFRNWIEEALEKRITWSPIPIGRRGGRKEYHIDFEDGTEGMYYIDFENQMIEEV